MYSKQRVILLTSFMAIFLFFIAACSTVGSITPDQAGGNQEETNHEEPTQVDSTEQEQTAENASSEEQSKDIEQPAENPSSEKTTEEPSEPLRPFAVNTKNYKIAPVDPASEEEKFVLLTFDDTPTNKSTLQILDTLDKYQAKAIFFVNGHYAEPHLELLKEIKNRGHIIGNHTWWHIYIRKESPEKVKKEIVELNDFIEEHLGERPKFFRPPFGQNSEVSLEVIKEEGMQTMNWSNGSLDWELKTPEAITQQVLSNIKNGDNILFHDKQTTADALDEILRQLKEQGYQFVLPTEVVLPD